MFAALTLLLAGAAATSPAASPSGHKLQPSQTCYAITGGSGAERTPMGATFQTVERATVAGRPVWRVVVHQRIEAAHFDMRDAFVLDGETLRPLSFENTRAGKLHVRLTYGPDRVTGEKVDDQGVSHPVGVALPGPVWEGNLYALTFGALPLKAGASFEVPTYQYDKGVGALFVSVTGSETVQTPNGPVEAWVMNGGPNPASAAQYLIAKADGRELGYRHPRGGQELGGDCTGLN